jgi:Flp pilus assembly protein CpaB
MGNTMSRPITDEHILDYIDGILPEIEEARVRALILSEPGVEKIVVQQKFVEAVAGKTAKIIAPASDTIESSIMTTIAGIEPVPTHSGLLSGIVRALTVISEQSGPAASGMIGALVVMLVIANLYLYRSLSYSPQVVAEQGIDVYVPTTELKPGTRLSPELFKKVRLPGYAVQGGAITELEELDGKFARTLLFPEQQLTASLVISRNLSLKQSSPKDDALHAVSIAVATNRDIEGMLRPGKLVDVIWATDIRGAHEVLKIAEQAEILSVSPDAARNEHADSRWLKVELLVPSEIGNKLILAEATGTLILGPYRYTEIVSTSGFLAK